MTALPRGKVASKYSPRVNHHFAFRCSTKTQDCTQKYLKNQTLKSWTRMSKWISQYRFDLAARSNWRPTQEISKPAKSLSRLGEAWVAPLADMGAPPMATCERIYRMAKLLEIKITISHLFWFRVWFIMGAFIWCFGRRKLETMGRKRRYLGWLVSSVYWTVFGSERDVAVGRYLAWFWLSLGELINLVLILDFFCHG